MMTDIGVGDVLAVPTGDNWAARLIRFGAALQGLPHSVNHIVIAHHKDINGKWQGIEGRPGGVGWVDMTRYLKSAATIDNREQPKTPAQRDNIAKIMEQTLKTGYDWEGIAADAISDLGIPALFATDWDNKGYPAHFVCSSLAAWGYDQVRLSRPRGPARQIQPGNWAYFNVHKQWLTIPTQS